MSSAVLRLAALSLVGLAALSVAACAGQVDPNADLLVSDADTSSSALASPDPGAAGAPGAPGASDGEDDDGDHDDGDHHGGKGGKGDHPKGPKDHCNGQEHGEHAHHRHHKFKVLDGIDGTKDHVITIAALPAALPPRLIARLHAIDTDGDGLVTKDEVKAWKQAHGD
jgi:hypothetical protein